MAESDGNSAPRAGKSGDEASVNVLQRARLRQGFTARQMADWLGIHPHTWELFELGAKSPPLTVLFLLAKQWGEDVHELLDGFGLSRHTGTGRLQAVVIRPHDPPVWSPPRRI